MSDQTCWLVLLLSGFLLVSPTATPAASSNLIAYIDSEGDLFVMRPDGTGRRRLASGEMLHSIAFPEYGPQTIQNGQGFYSWPVWSPDSRRLACFRIASDPDGLHNGLYIVDVATARVLNAYTAPDLHPIYAYWAPDSRHVAVLLGGRGALSLGLWPVSGGQRPKTLASGVPFYFDWRTDAGALLIHTGGDPEAKAGHSVSLLDVKSGQRRLLSRAPAVFGPPSWSHDGQWLAYGDEVQEAEQAVLMVATADGSTPKPVSTVSQRIAIAWSPTSPLVAVASTSVMGDPLFEELRLVEVPSGKTRTLVKDRFAAYFWSPNGERILYAQRERASDLWAWVVVEVHSGKTHRVVDFAPARPLLQVFQFFDQYALSHRLWSPDSRRFVFTGSAGADAHPFEALRTPSVYVVEAAERATPQVLVGGHVAFWSPH